MRKIITFFIILALSVFGVSCGKKDDLLAERELATSDVTFKVSSGDRAVSDGIVNLPSYGSKKTDQNGIAFFSDIREGAYEVTVLASGYEEFNDLYTFNDQDQFISIGLRREAVQPPDDFHLVVGDGELALKWSPPTEIEWITGYRIFKSLDGSNFELLAELDTGGESYIDRQVVNGRIYYYAVQSVSIFDDYSRRTAIHSAIPNPKLTYNLVYSKIDPQLGNLNLYLLEEGREKELLASSARELCADYDPGSEQILYTSDQTGKSQIYLMDRSGKNIRQVSYAPMGVKEPKFSPDGTQIVYVNLADEQIYLMSSYGTEKRPVTQGTSPILLSGGRVLFLKADAHGVDNFYIIDLENGGLAQLTDFSTSVREPALSPDEGQIAYIREDKVCIIDINGMNERYITKPGNGDYLAAPGWSPDGSELLYISNDNPEQIPIIYVKGSKDNTLQGREVIGYGMNFIAY